MNNINLYDIILNPSVTEKSTNLSEMNKVVFKINSSADKRSVKKSVEKINISPKLILSSVKFHHSEKFRFWTALNAVRNNTKFVITSHGLADYRKYESNFDMWHEMADIRVTWATPENEKEIKLPATNLIDFKRKRKYYKYLSYVTSRQLFFPEEITQNHTDTQNEQSVQEFDLDNIKKFSTILHKKIFKN